MQLCVNTVGCTDYLCGLRIDALLRCIVKQERSLTRLVLIPTQIQTKAGYVIVALAFFWRNLHFEACTNPSFFWVLETAFYRLTPKAGTNLLSWFCEHNFRKETKRFHNTVCFVTAVTILPLTAYGSASFYIFIVNTDLGCAEVFIDMEINAVALLQLFVCFKLCFGFSVSTNTHIAFAVSPVTLRYNIKDSNRST